jgi:hypothetical protein
MVPLLAVTVLPTQNFGFFAAGLSIWKEHCGFSSMVIMAPALSNSGRELFLLSLACLFHTNSKKIQQANYENIT